MEYFHSHSRRKHMSDSIISAGKKAPAFNLPDQDGEKLRLSSLKGQWVVLYFYPRDLTPGCTTEALDFTRLKANFEKEGAVILGVSPDTPEKHCRFIEKKELTIRLLSDEDHSVIEKYGAWQLKKFMGKEFMGVVRSTWLIDPTGKVIQTWSPVKVKNHAEDVLLALKNAK
jgi:peroxiredoxin Q/BCP